MSTYTKSTRSVSNSKSVRPKSCPNYDGQFRTGLSQKAAIKSASSGYSTNSSGRSLTDKQNYDRYAECFEDSSDESSSDESGLSGDEDSQTLHRTNHGDESHQKLSPTKQYKMEVMRRILEEFDLQKTLEYYANQSVPQGSGMSYDKKDYSPECAYQAELLRRRMVLLTGTDQMNTNDREYSATLRLNLQQEHELGLDRAEKARADLEKKRMHRLMKDGTITYDDVKDDPIFLKEWQKTKLKYSRTTPKQRTNAGSKKSKRAQTAPVSDTKDTSNASAGNSLMIKPTNPPPSARKPAERPRTVQWESRKDRGRYREENQEKELDEIDFTRWPSYNKYNDPLICKLQDEQSVTRLYDIAEDLLDGKLPSQMGKSEPKKKVVAS